jgi:acyl carrier protein
MIATPGMIFYDIILSRQLAVGMWSAQLIGGDCMTGLALSSRISALKEGSLARKIRAYIAEHVGVDAEAINDDSDFSEDLGLDLIEVIELTILLEDEFAGGRLTGEADEIELVGDLVRHIERANDGWIGVAG